MRKPTFFLSIAILILSGCLFFSCDDSFTDETPELLVKLDEDQSGSESARVKKSKFPLTQLRCEYLPVSITARLGAHMELVTKALL